MKKILPNCAHSGVDPDDLAETLPWSRQTVNAVEKQKVRTQSDRSRSNRQGYSKADRINMFRPTRKGQATWGAGEKLSRTPRDYIQS